MIVKNITARQIVTISRKRPVSDFAQAEEIVQVFYEDKLTSIPQCLISESEG